MTSVIDAEQVVSILERAGATEAAIDAARALAGLAAPSPVAAAAAKALRIRWRPGRTPATHVVAGVLAIAGSTDAALIVVASALARARASADLEHARGCLAVFAPLASALGTVRLAQELEDLAFKHLDREAYDATARFVSRRRAEREQVVAAARERIARELDSMRIAAQVSGRAKHLYSIHGKLARRGAREPSITDLFGIRVVVPDTPRCYEALGAIHLFFSPVAGRFRDYVRHPKSSGYRALHTVVRLEPSGDAVEVQIRSKAMHEQAERGTASHLLYKHGTTLETIRDPRWVYVLTPEHEVKRLPRGSTPLDFAYAVHTDLGDGFAGARIDDRIATAGTALADGDEVEIFHAADRPRQRASCRPAAPEARR